MSEAEDAFAFQLTATKATGWTREYRFAPPRQWRFDFAWPARKVAVEVEGGGYVNGRHSRGAGMEKDTEKYNTAMIGGWYVLRVTPKQVESGQALHWLELLAGAVVQVHGQTT
jgi:very-short-patch-repair endonuclease